MVILLMDLTKEASTTTIASVITTAQAAAMEHQSKLEHLRVLQENLDATQPPSLRTREIAVQATIAIV